MVELSNGNEGNIDITGQDIKIQPLESSTINTYEPVKTEGMDFTETTEKTNDKQDTNSNVASGIESKRKSEELQVRSENSSENNVSPIVKRPRGNDDRQLSIPNETTEINIPAELKDKLLPTIPVQDVTDSGMSDVDRYFSDNINRLGSYDPEESTEHQNHTENMNTNLSEQNLHSNINSMSGNPPPQNMSESLSRNADELRTHEDVKHESFTKLTKDSALNRMSPENPAFKAYSTESTISPPSRYDGSKPNMDTVKPELQLPSKKDANITPVTDGPVKEVVGNLTAAPATYPNRTIQKPLQKTSRLVIIYDKPHYYHMIMQLNELRSNPFEIVTVVELSEIMQLVKDPAINTTRYNHVNLCIEYNEQFKYNLRKFIDFIENNTAVFERFDDVNYHIQFAPDKKWKQDYSDDEKAEYKRFIDTLHRAFGDKIAHCSIINKYDMDTVYLTERSDLAKLGQEIQDDIIHWKNLKVLDYGESSIRFLPGVKLPESLEVLNIGGGYALETLTGFKMPTKLRTLLASQNAVHSIDNVTFPSTLERLELSDNKIYFLNQVEFPPRLEHLDVSQNRIESLRGVNFPRTLKSLNLGFNPIESIKGVKFPEDLVLLDISNIPNESMTGVKFPDLLEVLNLQASMTNTRGLKLPNTLTKLIMADNGVNSINPLRLPDSIEVLYLNNNNIKTLNKVQFPTNLKELYLGDNLITTLKNVTFPSTLEVLDIEMDPDYDEHEKHITTLKDITFPDNLKVLKLGYHSIKVIESIDFPPSLITLNLAYNEIKVIKNVRFGSCLKTLDISGNQELTNIDGFIVPDTVTELRIPPELTPNLPGYIIERANRKQMLLKKSLPY